MFSWFDSREATEFGTSLADFFAERIPAKSIGRSDKKAIHKFNSVVELMHRRASDFRQRGTLNMYKRAKLMNAFQWRLLELGYDEALVGEMTKTLVRSL
jgi:hypothetical protein